MRTLILALAAVALIAPAPMTRAPQAQRTEVWFWLVVILLGSFVIGNWTVEQFPAPLRGAALRQPRVQLAPPSSPQAPAPPRVIAA